MNAQNNGDAKGFEPDDGRGEDIAGGALYHVLDQGAEPCSPIGPGAAAVVLEQNIGRGALELARDQARLRIGDGATARQCEIECFIPVRRRNRAGFVFAAGANGQARR